MCASTGIVSRMDAASVCVSVLSPGFTGDLEFVMTPFSDLIHWQAAVSLAALQTNQLFLSTSKAFHILYQSTKDITEGDKA